MTLISVSVVIPCFNCDKTIWRAVHSVMRQSCAVHEIILVNDSSSDDTLTVLQDIKSYFPAGFVKIVCHESNKGPASARNSGWNAAGAEFVAFLDADDSWHFRKIELQHRWMAENPGVAISAHLCGYGKINNEKLEFEEISSKQVKWINLLFFNRIPTLSVMLKRQLSERFVEGKRYAEDYLLWLHLVSNGEKIHILRVELASKHKPEFGAGGLSGNLLLMEKGEIDCYRTLYKERRISKFMFFACLSFSLGKYVRRIVISNGRAVFRGVKS